MRVLQRTFTIVSVHDGQKWMIVQKFYNGVTYTMSAMIYAVAEETLMNKMEEEAYNLIEETTLNNYHWSNDMILFQEGWR